MTVVIAVTLANIDAARAGADNDALSLRRTAGSERTNGSSRGDRGRDNDPFHGLPPDLDMDQDENSVLAIDVPMRFANITVF